MLTPFSVNELESYLTCWLQTLTHPNTKLSGIPPRRFLRTPRLTVVAQIRISSPVPPQDALMEVKATTDIPSTITRVENYASAGDMIILGGHGRVRDGGHDHVLLGQPHGSIQVGVVGPETAQAQFAAETVGSMLKMLLIQGKVELFEVTPTPAAEKEAAAGANLWTGEYV